MYAGDPHAANEPRTRRELAGGPLDPEAAAEEEDRGGLIMAKTASAATCALPSERPTWTRVETGRPAQLASLAVDIAATGEGGFILARCRYLTDCARAAMNVSLRRTDRPSLVVKQSRRALAGVLRWLV